MLTKPVADWLFDMVSNLNLDVQNSAKRKQALLQLSQVLNQGSTSGVKDIADDFSIHKYLIGYKPDKKVQLIKWVRSVTGMGLKEAKDTVESFGFHEPSGKVDVFMVETTPATFGSFKSDLVAIGELWTDLGPSVTKTPAESDVVERTCYLLFELNSKTVECYAKPPVQQPGQVAVQVNARIPMAAFDPVRIVARVEVPEAGLNPDVLVDLKEAVGMAYGHGVNLVIEPAPTA